MRFAFNTSGICEAVIIGNWAYGREGRQIGWLPFDQFHVYDSDGAFLWRLWPDGVLDTDVGVLTTERQACSLTMPKRPDLVRVPIWPVRHV